MKIINLILLFFTFNICYSQPIPSKNENIPFLVTFGSEADKSWGDDDFSQTFFVSIPKSHTGPFFIRVFDPDTGGAYDEGKGEFNTKTKFSVYGGKGCITTKDAKNVNPVGNYKSGNLLASKTFSTEYDQKWYTFGPFNPTSGEYVEEYGGYIFKIICDGLSGDDGNLYKYYISTLPNSNKPVEGGNAFTFEYTFRLHDDPKEISHLYPYVDKKVISVKQSNFDWDDDGEFKFVTKARYAIYLKKSGNNNWGRSEHKILEKEKESSFDLQMHKNKTNPAKNNNVSLYITNQYGGALPFYVIPIGGIPKPSTSIKMKR
jgi:hypothetical protein